MYRPLSDCVTSGSSNVSCPSVVITPSVGNRLMPSLDHVTSGFGLPVDRHPSLTVVPAGGDMKTAAWRSSLMKLGDAAIFISVNNCDLSDVAIRQ